MAPPTISLLLLLFSSSFTPLLSCNTCPPPHKIKPKPTPTPTPTHDPKPRPNPNPKPFFPPVTLPPPHYQKPSPPPPSPPKHPKDKPCPPPPPHFKPPTVKPNPPPSPSYPPATPYLPPPIPPVTPFPPYIPPPKPETCPIDALKLGACVDLLGGLIHVGLGDPVVNQCCPILKGLVELEAAVCLCTTIKLKLLNLTLYAPLALELLITCGKNPPPGYTCTL